MAILSNRLAAGTIVIALLFCSGVARGENALSLTGGWASYALPDPKDPDKDLGSLAGAGIGAEFEYTFAEPFALRADLWGSAYWVDDGGGPAYIALATVGGTYRFDVLRYVPYASAGLGGVLSAGNGADATVSPVLSLAGGLDILTRRDRSWGVELRLASFAGDITMLTAGVRGTHRWGAF